MGRKSAVAASSAGPAAPGEETARPGLWQVPTFLLGLAVLVGMWIARPLWYNPEARRVERDLELAREVLDRPDADLDEVMRLTGDALERADRFPQQAGEAHFLLGSAYLRRAQAGSAEDWDRAHTELTQAEQIGVPEGDSLRLAFRLGKAGYYSHADPEQVVHYLAQSVEDAADDPAEGYTMLVQAYLHLPTPDLPSALKANQKLLDLPTENEQVMSPARLLQGELLLQLHRPLAAHGVLRRIPPSPVPDIYYQARYTLATSCQEEKLWDEAAQLWKEILDAHREPAGQRTRVSYFLALCYHRLGRDKEAAAQWEDAARGETGRVGRACAFRLAELRLQGSEPARSIEAFEWAFRGLNSAEDYGTDHLVSLAEARNLCESGCRVLSKAGDWEQAQKLADWYQLLAPPGSAQALFGQIADGAARSLQEQAQKAPHSEARHKLEEAARAQVAKAAAAYQSAAEVATDKSQQADWLWLSADRYLQVRDHYAAVAVLRRFLGEGGQQDRRGEAWYRLAEAQRALRKDVDAHQAYRQCLDYPGPFAFRARYQLALAEIEQGQTAEAEKALERNLELMQQAPDSEANEKTLFALAGLLFQQRNYLIASLRLEEALEHYPASSEAVVARRQLADCYRRLATQEGQHLQLSERSTADAQLHYRKQYRLWLEKAAANYQKLEDDLLARQGVNPLAPAEEMQLRDASFALAECRFDLGTSNYDEAIRLYEVLAKRYEKRVEGLNALVQITRCYWVKHETGKARETLQRLRTALAEMNDATLQASPGAWPRKRWEEWLQEASKL